MHAGGTGANRISRNVYRNIMLIETMVFQGEGWGGGETGSGQHCLRLVLSFIEKASLVVQRGMRREWW